MLRATGGGGGELSGAPAPSKIEPASIMDPLAQLIGDSPGMAAVRDKVRRLVQRRSDSRRLPPILIQGETGTGKGLLARSLHAASPRAAGPFVDVNCAAIPETLLESEMFGYERGAFTDARQAKPGLFQTAHRGTIFLDEVGLLPEGLQAKLLKVIEDQAVRRLGSTRSEPVDVWIVAATSENLAAALRGRRFREDLYHRLAVVAIGLPPLRERGRDILRLAEHFLARACADYGLPVKSLTPEAQAALAAYPWPGNLRELANVLERVALLGEARGVTQEMLGLPGGPVGAPAAATLAREPRARTETGRGAERERLVDALRETDWNISRAATRLGLSRNTLRYRLEKYGLQSSRAARGPAAAPAERPSPAVAAALAPSLPVVVRWDRRHVTLLQATLVPASTPASLADQSRELAVLVEKVQSFGGRVEGLTPSSLQAEFGLEPTPSGEDAPSRAAHAAMAMQKAGERAREGDRERAAPTIALHTGPVLVGRVGETAEIDAEAKREAWGVVASLLLRAEPGAIVASDGAATFLERRFELLPLGSPEGGYRLAGRERVGLGPGGRMAKFVGRRQELALLESRWVAAFRSHGQAVGIVGEAGVGKSRLVHEFRRMLARRGVALLRARCAAYTQAMALVPLLEIVRGFCRIRGDDDPETARAKVERALAPLGLSSVHRVALLELLGLVAAPADSAVEPEERRRRAFEALGALGLTGTVGRPVVIVLEDLHWIDRSSEDFLTGFLPRIESAPLMFIFTYRPEYTAPWATRPSYTQIPIQELSREDAGELLEALLSSEVSEDVRHAIQERARGNPFYLEEEARATVEHGARRPADAVPDTIEDVIMSRVDRLPDEPRRLLQTASVLGREVSLRLLGAVWGATASAAGEPGPHLATLVQQGFLSERMDADESIYLFKHTLTQEVAYLSLPAPDRRALHLAAARALEALHADRLPDVFDRLAYHYARTDHADRAVLYLTRFAKQAARISAHAEAVAALQQALAHIEALPAGRERDRRTLDLVLRQARSLFFLGRSQESLEALLAQQARLETLEDPSLAARFHFLLARNLSLAGDQARAVQYAEQAIAEATRCGDEATLGKACYVLAREAYWAGRPVRAIEQSRDAIARLEAFGERVWLGQAEWVLGVSQAFRGEFTAALDTLARVEARGQALGDPNLVSYGAATAGDIRAAMGDWEQGIEDCQRGVDRSPDPLNRAFVVGALGHAHLEKGDATAAAPLLDESRRLFHDFGFRQMEGWTATRLGEARLLAGDLPAALTLAQAGLEVARAGYAVGLGFAQRLLGRVRQAEGRLEDARAEMRAALATFGESGARFEVGRTHMGLAEVAHAAGDAPAAAEHVQAAAGVFAALGVPVYAARTAALAGRLGVPLPA
jgi:DNA-binding NtrC family response regulator/tetratricopeptide (TPR) repeat protein